MLYTPASMWVVLAVQVRNIIIDCAVELSPKTPIYAALVGERPVVILCIHSSHNRREASSCAMYCCFICLSGFQVS
jgi:hypothetical protein